MGPRNSVSRTAAATAARRGSKNTPDMEDHVAKDPPQKPRPKPTRKALPGSTNPPANVEVDTGLAQGQGISGEPETHSGGDGGDIDHSGEWDSNYDGGVGGDLDEDYRHGDGYGADHGTDHDSRGSDDGGHGSSNIDEIPERWNGYNTAPVPDEYGSEPEQYSQQEGASVAFLW